MPVVIIQCMHRGLGPEGHCDNPLIWGHHTIFIKPSLVCRGIWGQRNLDEILIPGVEPYVCRVCRCLFTKGEVTEAMPPASVLTVILAALLANLPPPAFTEKVTNACSTGLYQVFTASPAQDPAYAFRA